MKLHEIKRINEAEAYEKTTASELWDTLTPGHYKASGVFLVRETPQGKFEVMSDSEGARKAVEVLDGHTLNTKYAEIRPGEQPDAEGFTKYQLNREYEAAKYDGDTVDVDMGNEEFERMSRGDYLLRVETPKGYEFSFARGSIFDRNFTPA